MELNEFFRSVLEQDTAPIVICDLNHTIVYMNPSAAANYLKWGGYALMGKNLMDCHNSHSKEMMEKVLRWFAASREHNRIFTHHNPKRNKDVYMVAMRDEEGTLIGYYEKHECRNSETALPYDFGGWNG